ncbi:peptidase [Corchorus olitorius]|uniref:Peptidase n=1 Tax=Corchorus olitorius TaxID=93759 RepID=A0A1R3H6Y6_9ROSI|nr:peptidase [Corchorus olitorius]
MGHANPKSDFVTVPWRHVACKHQPSKPYGQRRRPTRVILADGGFVRVKATVTPLGHASPRGNVPIYYLAISHMISDPTTAVVHCSTTVLLQ